MRPIPGASFPTSSRDLTAPATPTGDRVDGLTAAPRLAAVVWAGIVYACYWLAQVGWHW